MYRLYLTNTRSSWYPTYTKNITIKYVFLRKSFYYKFSWLLYSCADLRHLGGSTTKNRANNKIYVISDKPPVRQKESKIYL